MKLSSTQHYYNNNAASLTNRYEQAEMATTHEKLIELFTPGDRLLECGAGSGRDATVLLHKGMDITASDSSPEMISEALRFHPELTNRIINLQIPEGLNIYPPGSFDGVYSIATLMHLDQSQFIETLKQVYRILRPGGKFHYSICLERSGLNQAGIDNKGRYFLIREQKWWEDRTTEAGFTLIGTMVNSDGLGREEVTWLTLQAAKP